MFNLNKIIVVAVIFFSIKPILGISADNDIILTDKNVALKVSNATKLLKQKAYAKSCSEVMDLATSAGYVDRSKPKLAQLKLNINYILGQCHAGLGLFQQASMYFERVVLHDPSEPRPYLDLALSYQYLGEYGLADDQYSELLDMPTLSPIVREKIEVLYSNNPNKVKYLIDLSSGAISDSNINNAPISESVTMWDTEFIFNNDSRPKSEVGVYLAMDATANKLLNSKSRLSGAIKVNTTTFLSEPDHNSAVIDLGVTYHRKLWKGEYSVQTRLANVSIGNESLLNVIGVNGIYSMLPFNNLRTTAKVGLNTFQYSTNSDLDISEVNTSFLANYQISNKWLLNSEFGVAYGTASEDENSYTNVKFDIGGNYSVTNSLLLSMMYRYNPRTYQGDIEAFEETRSDTRSLFNTELNYNFKDSLSERITLDLGVNLFQNTSNIEVYENDRTQAYLIFHFTL